MTNERSRGGEAPRGRGAWMRRFLGPIAFLLAGGEVEEAQLDNPDFIPLLVDSAHGAFECAFTNYVLLAGNVGDELMNSGSFAAHFPYDQRAITPSTPGSYASSGCANDGGLYLPVSQARFLADDALRRMETFTEQDVPNLTALRARTAAMAGYSYVLFGEGWCSAAFDSGTELTPPQVLAIAEERFSRAIEWAQASGATNYLNLARVGRARTRLNLGNLAGAAADASQVPEGFRFEVTRSLAHATRENKIYNLNHLERRTQVEPAFWDLEWKGVPDLRVEAIQTGRPARDGLVPEVLQTKYTSPSTPIPLARYEEALLIIGEAEGGQRAVEVINYLHDQAGLPGFDPATDGDPVLHLTREERRRELFLESHRLNDMLRFNLPFPSGVQQWNRREYGNTTCFPLPDVERNNNPNIP
jgi:starch-binding outer membrane protein, SusD/RagB family